MARQTDEARMRRLLERAPLKEVEVPRSEDGLLEPDPEDIPKADVGPSEELAAIIEQKEENLQINARQIQRWMKTPVPHALAQKIGQMLRKRTASNQLLIRAFLQQGVTYDLIAQQTLDCITHLNPDIRLRGMHFAVKILGAFCDPKPKRAKGANGYNPFDDPTSFESVVGDGEKNAGKV